MGTERQDKESSLHNTSHVCCVALDDDSLRQFWEIEDYHLQEPALFPEEKRLFPEESRVMEHFSEYHTRIRMEDSSSHFHGRKMFLHSGSLGRKQFADLNL